MKKSKSFWSDVVKYFAKRKRITRKQMHKDFNINPQHWTQGTILDRYRCKLENLGYLIKGDLPGIYYVVKDIPLTLKSTGKIK